MAHLYDCGYKFLFSHADLVRELLGGAIQSDVGFWERGCFEGKMPSLPGFGYAFHITLNRTRCWWCLHHRLKFWLKGEGQFSAEYLNGLQRVMAAIFRMENTHDTEDAQLAVRYLGQAVAKSPFNPWYVIVQPAGVMPTGDISRSNP